MAIRTGFEFFESGPFASASVNIEVMSQNLYYSYLLDQSIAQHERSKEKFEKALRTNDLELVEQARTQLDHLEGILKLAFTYNAFEELES